MGERRPLGCGSAAVICLVATFVAVQFSGDDPAAAPADSAAETHLVASETLSACSDLLRQGEATGVIRKIDRASKRLYVDQALWGELGPDGRRGVTAAALCQWFGVKIAGSDFENRVTVVGWQTGQRLSSIAGGMYFDSAD